MDTQQRNGNGGNGNGLGARRRFEPAQPHLADSAADYFELARDHFARLELDAREAATELDSTLEEVLGRLGRGDGDRQRFEAFGESLIEHNLNVAERTAHLRRRLERRGGLEPTQYYGRRATDMEPQELEVPQEFENGNGRRTRRLESGPSEGVVLLTRQMAASGASDRRIGEVLTRLGVSDAEQAVKRSLK